MKTQNDSEPLGIVTGYLSADGSILYSPTPDAFVSRRFGAGSYGIYFTPRFAGKPIILAQIHNGHYWVATTTINEESAFFSTATTPGGAGADYPFMFIAIGVRRSLR